MNHSETTIILYKIEMEKYMKNVKDNFFGFNIRMYFVIYTNK